MNKKEVKKAKPSTKIDKRKKAMVVALEKTLGIVSLAAKEAKIDRTTHYLWMDKDEEYRKQVEEIAETAIDFAESSLFKRMKEGSDTAMIFYLKTKGKKRGYIERQEIQSEFVTPPGGRRIVLIEEGSELADKIIQRSKREQRSLETTT